MLADDGNLRTVCMLLSPSMWKGPVGYASTQHYQCPVPILVHPSKHDSWSDLPSTTFISRSESLLLKHGRQVAIRTPPITATSPWIYSFASSQDSVKRFNCEIFVLKYLNRYDFLDNFQRHNAANPSPFMHTKVFGLGSIISVTGVGAWGEGLGVRNLIKEVVLHWA